VIVEERTHNVTLVNCFTRKLVEAFPWESNFLVFAILTDGMGEAPIEVIMHHLDTMDEVYKHSGTLRFASPLHEVRCRLRIRNCLFPEAGYYVVSLFVSSELVAERRFILEQREINS